MNKLTFVILLSFLFSCVTNVNHCKKVQKDSYKVQQKMERARRRASR
jgi:hypothetical protein